MGRYRLRTRLRRMVPFGLTVFFPKGRKDCGEHEWYRSAGDIYHCYHCAVGVRRGGPES